MKPIPKPLPGEYDPYAIVYIQLLPDDGMILKHLRSNGRMVEQLLRSLTPEEWVFRYAEGKWTIKEILLHMIDDERIYSYRALRFARNDSTELPGFNQDPYVIESKANERTAASLMEEYAAVRNATISLCENLPEEAWMRGGRADNHPTTVRALIYHLAGHELHHMNIIKEKYLPAR